MSGDAYADALASALSALAACRGTLAGIADRAAASAVAELPHSHSGVHPLRTELAAIADIARSAAGPIPQGRVVHALKWGQALCGAGVPTAWPVGDRWVGFDDPGAHQLATCPACLAALPPRRAAP